MNPQILPGDPAYARIFNFWKANDKPTICQMADANYLALHIGDAQDTVAFIKLAASEDDFYRSTSLTPR